MRARKRNSSPQCTRLIESAAAMAQRDGPVSRPRAAQSYVETYLADSWAEHLRQHTRSQWQIELPKIS